MAWWKKIIKKSEKDNAGPSENTDAGQTGKTDTGQRNFFPVHIELIAEKLYAHVYFHEIESRDGLLPCWTYVSEGLWAHKQKELILTLLSNPNVKVTQFPNDPIRFFFDVYKFAEQGKLVDVGGISDFNPPGFLGRPAMVYIFPQPLSGVEIPSPAVAACLITEDELAAYDAFGLTRVLSRLGNEYHFFPCPPWSDLTRSSIPFHKTLQESILTKSARIRQHGMRVRLERECITLRLFSHAWQPLNSYLAQISSDTTDLALALLTEPDPDANGYLVWEPGQTGSRTIKPFGSDGSRLVGCFLTFLTNQVEDGGGIYEDGFYVRLTNASWAAIQKAIETQQEILIPATQEKGYSFSIKWLEEGYYNPIDGMTIYTDSGYERFSSENPRRGDETEPVQVKENILLTSSPEMERRVSVEAHGAYLVSIYKVVQEHFTALPQITGHDFLVQFEVQPGGHVDIKTSSRPEIKNGNADELGKRLLTLPPPNIKEGPIKFQIIFTIRGGSSISSDTV
jgi:hypothetical protein